jgi:Tyrosyl-tRNA synthetase
LFSGKVNEENMPSTKIEEAELVDGKISILDLLISCELANSKSEGRRLIEQGGLTLNEVKVTSLELEITVEELQKAIVMKKGKKIFHKAYI